MKLEHVAFLTVETVEEIHSAVLDASGGMRGVLNQTALLSAVETPKATFDGAPLYPSLAEMASAYAWGIARNHAFVDANKRTALVAAWTFLATNGQRIVLEDWWTDFMVRVASEAGFDRTELVGTFRELMSGDVAVE